jgi:ferrous iron transport protein A
LNVVPLHELALGTPATIITILGSDNITQRLLELGLLDGDTLEVIAVAPLGDPIEIQARHGCLSLRKSEAARILVEPASP